MHIKVFEKEGFRYSYNISEVHIFHELEHKENVRFNYCTYSNNDEPVWKSLKLRCLNEEIAKKIMEYYTNLLDKATFEDTIEVNPTIFYDEKYHDLKLLGD